MDRAKKRVSTASGGKSSCLIITVVQLSLPSHSLTHPLTHYSHNTLSLSLHPRAPDDFEAVRAIAMEVGNEVHDDGYVPVICGLSRTRFADLERAWEAVRCVEFTKALQQSSQKMRKGVIGVVCFVLSGAGCVRVWVVLGGWGEGCRTRFADVERAWEAVRCVWWDRLCVWVQGGWGSCWEAVRCFVSY